MKLSRSLITVSRAFKRYNRCIVFLVGCCCASVSFAQASNPAATGTSSTDGEFDHPSHVYVRNPLKADPDYEDTEFGRPLYNEASIPTKLEILRLLSKDTPSLMVFLQAISMGLGIDEVLDAAIQYQPEKGRDFAQSAVSLLPLISESVSVQYGTYDVEDLDRQDPSKPYSVDEVARRFFDDRQILTPYPDWIEGQYHFNASVAELDTLQRKTAGTKWYRTKSTKPESDRPVFVSLYESNHLILVDGQARIRKRLREEGPDSTLPVVFIFNRLNERPIDQLGYEKTIKGIQKAFSENTLMVTPAPEWHTGEYHIFGGIEEIYDIFEIPSEQDFEPAHWRQLLAEAENYKVTNSSLVFTLLGSGEDERASRESISGQHYAQYEDPRSEAAFPHVSSDANPVTFRSLVGQGIIMNRPDLVAALNALGVTEVPIVFYYINNDRSKPYSKGPRALIGLATGAEAPATITSGGGGFGPPPPEDCASPPCQLSP